MDSKEAIYPLFYFGNIAYWKEALQSTNLILDIGFPLPKKSYANRTIILSANGLQTLSIPLIGGRGSKIRYRDVEISYSEKWVEQHKMALISAYSKSPFFEFYAPYFFAILNSKPKFLYELNEQLLREIYRLLKLKLNINYSTSAPFIPQKFIPQQFNDELVVYPQVFRYKFDFYPDLSILDLLFNLGTKSKDYLLT